MGPTCVGKTSQSLAIARLLKSPVINCDSRQIYKEPSGWPGLQEEELSRLNITSLPAIPYIKRILRVIMNEKPGIWS